ncbi:alpha 1,2 mannosyltransferase [Tieghemiomyces parasiticus]|uniref:Mannosyltransferase n=1 Tax=Tieghemiomyces parasiticus TaxID=78921 RepID=A0A9W8DTM7_9FUNG|nr:alpha 1,2 mannosyltransferase [Tieghemiomyces parasiticus]
METTAYLSLAALRLAAAVLPGYIHPDEFFQSAEIAAGSVANYAYRSTWEFEPDAPCRSIVPVYLMSGVPMGFLRLASAAGVYVLGQPFQPTVYTVLWVERLWAVALSFLVDRAVYNVLRRYNVDPRQPLLLLATSFLSFTFMARGFSNALETVLLSLSSWALCRVDTAPVAAGKSYQNTYKTDFAFGAIFALGVFTRITYVAYSFPLVAYYLWCHIRRAREAPNAGCIARMGRFVLDTSPCIVGLVLSSLGCLAADAVYYNRLTALTKLGRLVIQGAPCASLLTALNQAVVLAPLNLLRYNTRPENLAQHGLHPSYLHVLVNFPLLFGPLAVVFYTVTLGRLLGFGPRMGAVAVNLHMAVATLGLVALSAVPHQEPRFLLPMLPSVVIATQGFVTRTGSTFWRLWLAFNALLLIVFGVAHQGGVVPVLNYIQTSTLGHSQCAMVTDGFYRCTRGLQPGVITPSPAVPLTESAPVFTRAVFYRTFMPPPHLLAQPAAAGPESFELVDLAGRSRAEFMAYLEAAGPRDPRGHLSADYWTHHTVYRRHTDADRWDRTLLVYPASTKFTAAEERALRERSFRVFTANPHVNFDDIGTVLKHPFTAASLVVRQLY